MLEWREKIELSQELLKSAEDQMKSGQIREACISQRKASKIGIQAYEALIDAQEIIGKDENIETVRNAKHKWRSLNNCNLINQIVNKK